MLSFHALNAFKALIENKGYTQVSVQCSMFSFADDDQPSRYTQFVNLEYRVPGGSTSYDTIRLEREQVAQLCGQSEIRDALFECVEQAVAALPTVDEARRAAVIRLLEEAQELAEDESDEVAETVRTLLRLTVEKLSTNTLK